jgi:hypothetical protein
MCNECSWSPATCERVRREVLALLRPSKVVGVYGLPELAMELGDKLIHRADMAVTKQLELYGRMVEEVARHARASNLDEIILYVAGHRRLIPSSEVHASDVVLLQYAQRALGLAHVNKARFTKELARRLHWAASTQQHARQLLRKRS